MGAVSTLIHLLLFTALRPAAGAQAANALALLVCAGRTGRPHRPDLRPGPGQSADLRQRLPLPAPGLPTPHPARHRPAPTHPALAAHSARPRRTGLRLIRGLRPLRTRRPVMHLPLGRPRWRRSRPTPPSTSPNVPPSPFALPTCCSRSRWPMPTSCRQGPPARAAGWDRTRQERQCGNSAPTPGPNHLHSVPSTVRGLRVSGLLDHKYRPSEGIRAMSYFWPPLFIRRISNELAARRTRCLTPASKSASSQRMK